MHYLPCVFFFYSAAHELIVIIEEAPSVENPSD